MSETVIEMNNIVNILGGHTIHQGANLKVYRGEILGIVGGSGSGKTTLLRNILMLLPPTSGQVKVFDQDVNAISEAQAKALRHRWGVTFQHSALFGSLSVLQNVIYPMREFKKIDAQFREELALLKILMAGLDIDAANKYPAELSGGMQKRAALARAIALDPELLFLDEPTAGLDPKSANAFDELILHLRDTLGLTVVIITHDLDTLWQVTDRVAFLGEKQVLAAASMPDLVQYPHPMIQQYFAGPRGYRRDMKEVTH